MALKRLFQVAAAVESQGGQAVATLLTAANADFLVIDPAVDITPELFDRANINRSSLSPLQPLAGVVTGGCSFQTELAGTGSATVPQFGKLLRASGMQQVATRAVSIGAITNGPFYHGETITGGTGSGTATVIHDTYSGAAVLLHSAVTGTDFVATEVLTGGTSGATATVTTATSPWNYGTSWYPTSIELLTFAHAAASGVIAAGSVLVGQTSGAVAITQAAIPTSTGTATVRVLDGVFQASETLNDVTGGAETVAISGTPAFTMSQLPSLSLAVIEDGVAKVLKGCRGTWSLGAGVGEAMLFSWEFNGLVSSTSDAGTITGVTYTSLVPPPLLGVSFAVGDDADTTQALEASPRFQSVSFDHANSIGIGRDAGEAEGLYGSAHITSRASTGSMTVDVAPENVYAFMGRLRDGAPSRARLSIGSADGNKFLLSAPSMVFTGETGGDQEGIANRDMAFNLASRRPDGVDRDDSEIVLTYVADSTP